MTKIKNSKPTRDLEERTFLLATPVKIRINGLTKPAEGFEPWSL